MNAYLLLAGITGILALGTYWVFRRTRDRSFLLGMALLYFWTFMGAWFFIGDAMGGYKGYQIGLGYYYLMEKMFPFELDSCYLHSLMGYGGFTAALLGGVLFALPKKNRETPSGPLLVLDHRVFFLLALLATLCSFLLVRPTVLLAMQLEESIYLVTRTTAFQGATIHALCNELAAFSLLVGWALYLGARHPRYFASRTGTWPGWAYPVALLVLELYFMMLGNKHELFMGMVLGILLFLANSKRPNYRMLGVYLAFCVVPMVVTSNIRGASVQDLKALELHRAAEEDPFQVEVVKHVPRRAKADNMTMRLGQIFLSNEMFAAHFSLYGVCREQVQPVPGLSFRYLAAAAVPRVLRDQRPPTTYDIYADGAGLMPGQGYTIHQATGWYLNGGWGMLLAGGLVLGLAWGLLIRWRVRPPGSGLVVRIFSVMGVSCWVAYLPILLRDGPELLKGMVVEGMAIPMLAVLLSALVAKLANKQGTIHGA
jgi:hypothetical protein